MKSETIYITDQDRVRDAIDKILTLETGNKYQVTIGNAEKKTARQHRYQWRLYSDISKSGLGGINEETPDIVHRFCKKEWALPILLEKDADFAWLYEMVKQQTGNDDDKINYFIDNHVSTMGFTVIEGMDYIQSIINYYAPKGFELTDPSQYGLKR